MFAIQVRLIRRTPTSWLTLAVTTGVVAVAAGILLVVTSFPGAVSARDSRLAWRSIPVSNASDPAQADGWWKTTEYHFQEALITRFDVASVTSKAPLPGGLDHAPKPGELWVSPALESLLRSTPASKLGNRFPSQVAGTLRAEGLADPQELIAVVGQTPSAARLLGATPVMSGPPAARHQSNAILIVASGLVMVAVFGPLVSIMGSVTSVDVALRNNRLAALRLAGATPRQLLVAIAPQAVVGGVVGAAIGAAGFLVLRSRLAQVTAMGHRFFPTDLSPGAREYLAVGVGATVVTAAGALLGVRRLVVSPLGVYRRHNPSPPSKLRLIPVAIGFPLLAFLLGAAFGGSLPASVAVALVTVGFTVVLAGTLILGPWMNAAIGERLVRWAAKPGPLIAGRRLLGSPRDHAALVAGVIAAVFGLALFYGLIPGLESQVVTSPRAGLRPTTMKVDFAAVKGTPDLGPELTDSISRLEGVSTVTPATVLVATDQQGTEYVALLGDCIGLISALDITIDGPCAASPLALGSHVVAPHGALTFIGPASDTTKPGGQTALLDAIPGRPPRFKTDPAQLSVDLLVDPAALSDVDQGFFTETLYINLGSSDDIERIRTAILQQAPTAAVFTASEAAAAATAPFQAAHGPLDVAAVAIFVAGGLSAAVAGAGTILGQRQQLTGFRRVGIPLTTIRTISILESAIPLAVSSTLAAAAGLTVAWVLLQVGGVAISAPTDKRGLSVLLTCIAAASILAASPATLMRRVTQTTGPDPTT